MKKTISIIGGGPAALMLASKLDPNKFDVTIFEKNKTLGRKFLVAGKGGFNLTHSEPIQTMIERYTPSSFLENALLQFDNNHLRNWLKKIGVPTFVGSSKRVYPNEGIKPIEVLNAIMKELESKNVKVKYNIEWKGWSDSIINPYDYTVFALGGGSWKVTGSDGGWTKHFAEKNIETLPFQASNCAFKVNWEDAFIQKNEGVPLKNIAFICNERRQRGEAVITKFGLEGNAIYALSPQIRNQLQVNNVALIYLDLKPQLSESVVREKIKRSSLRNKSDILRKELRLTPAQTSLLKQFITKDEFMNVDLLANRIKNLPMQIEGIAPIDEAISTVGGISLEAVDSNFQLKNIADTFCIGEMLDWDAPTGGYLLQACFSMGAVLAKHLNEKN